MKKSITCVIIGLIVFCFLISCDNNKQENYKAQWQMRIVENAINKARSLYDPKDNCFTTKNNSISINHIKILIEIEKANVILNGEIRHYLQYNKDDAISNRMKRALNSLNQLNDGTKNKKNRKNNLPAL